MRPVISIVLIYLAAGAGCDNGTPKNDAKALGYGTNAHECIIGYCRRELRISGGSVEFTAFAHSPIKVSEIHMARTLEDRQTEKLWRVARGVDYTAIPAMSGCPGCNDHSVEWIEFEAADGKVKRIVFLSGQAPSELRALVGRCRELAAGFKVPDDWRRDVPELSRSRS